MSVLKKLRFWKVSFFYQFEAFIYMYMYQYIKLLV